MASITTEKVKELQKEGKKAAEIAKAYNITRQAVYCHIRKIKAQQKPKLSFSKPKRDYNSLIDWKIYNEGLVKRGEILIGFELLEDWDEQLSQINQGKAGHPYEYPPGLIEFLLRLKCSFKMDYRSLEGIARKLIVFIPQCKKAPDYTTLQVRFSSLECELEVYQEKESQEVAEDSSGLKTSNRGEYRMNKYRGKRKEYIKLHIVVNIKSRQVVSCSVTEEKVRDHQEMDKNMIEAKKYGSIAKGLFDAAYDCQDNYGSLATQGIKGVIRPRKTMSLEKTLQEIEQEKDRMKCDTYVEISGRLLRLETLKQYLEDENKWKEQNGYGQRWKSEGRFSVFKRIFGEHVFSKKIENQTKEVILKVSMMNLFTTFTVGAYKGGAVALN